MEILFAGVGLSVGVVVSMLAGRFILVRSERDKSTLTQALQERIDHSAHLELKLKESELALARSGEKLRYLDKIQLEHSQLASRIQHLLVEHESLKKEYQMSQRSHAEKVMMLQETKENIEKNFKQITSELYEQRSKEFQTTNMTHLENYLKPFKEQILNFEKKVDSEAKERAVLKNELQTLQQLNVQMRQDAINLTNALKGGNKTQGNWGEVVLERILEESGLTKGREYEVQVGLKDEGGKRYQPDMVVHLPDKKDIIIDSKVSLIAYERYISSESKEEKEQALGQHLRSIYAHIEGLSHKSYEDLVGVNSLDFVLLFMPIEGAFLTALEYDTVFFAKAFEKNIMVVSPSTLLVTLRTIANIWRYEHQSQNAMLIAEKAGALYDKFVGFVNDIEKIGKDIGRANESYEAALSKLSSGKGNLIGRVDGLKQLGVKTKRSLSAGLTKESLGFED